MNQERKAKGLYWDKAWKLVEGCTKVSPGCDNCWSETETVMRSGHPNEKIQGRAKSVTNYPYHKSFDGRILCREDNLDLPLRTKKPTVFAIWNDLFHEDVPDTFLDKVYAMMAHPLNEKHTFLILTKRPERMADFVVRAMYDPDCRYDGVYEELDNLLVPDATPCLNVWHGVTVENQEQADERIPHLLQVPGKRFLSVEPMLGLVNLRTLTGGFTENEETNTRTYQRYVDGIHAVLVGGESGKNARPMHPYWAMSLRGQCRAAGVPFFFKQWGECCAPRHMPADTFQTWDVHHGTEVHDFDDPKWRVGKKRAGRELDGVIHDDLPWGEK